LRRVVIDASVALAWCFPDEQSPYADKVLQELDGCSVLVPSVWALEITNGLLVGERRRRIGQSDILRFIDLLDALSPQEVSVPINAHFHALLPLGRGYGLSAYDAAYLHTAIRTEAELATADDALEKAARTAGVPIMCTSHLRKPRR